MIYYQRGLGVWRLKLHQRDILLCHTLSVLPFCRVSNPQTDLKLQSYSTEDVVEETQDEGLEEDDSAWEPREKSVSCSVSSGNKFSLRPAESCISSIVWDLSKNDSSPQSPLSPTSLAVWIGNILMIRHTILPPSGGSLEYCSGCEGLYSWVQFNLIGCSPPSAGDGQLHASDRWARGGRQTADHRAGHQQDGPRAAGSFHTSAILCQGT